MPYWFAVIASLVYGTGFLIDYTFYNSMGIRESSEEVFKAKYIYIGALCLYGPIAFGSLIIGYINAKQSPKHDGKLYLCSIATIAMQLFSIYMLIAFSRPGYFLDHERWIGMMFFIMALLTLIRWCEHKYDNSRGKAPFKRSWLENFINDKISRGILRVICAALTLGLMIKIFSDMFYLLSMIFILGGAFYLLLLLIAGVIIWYMIEMKTSGPQLIVGLTFPIALVYLSLLVFSYRIYPYIPASRGGGDYSRGERPSIVVFDKHSSDLLPESIVDQTSSSFSEDDFVNLSSLITKISGARGVISELLQNQGLPETLIIINSSVSNEDKEVALIEYLDALLREKSLYSPKLFKVIAASSETRAFLKQNLQDKNNVIHLNRLILEDAFSPELRRSIDSPPKGVSWPVTILDETPSTLFVSLDISKNDHCLWRDIGPDTKPKRIFAIRRDCVTSVIHYREIPFDEDSYSFSHDWCNKFVIGIHKKYSTCYWFIYHVLVP